MCAKACWHLVKQLARIRRSMAKLPLATIREVLNIVDSGGNGPEAMRRTQEALIGEISDEQDEPKGWDAAQELLDAEIAKRGWRIQRIWRLSHGASCFGGNRARKLKPSQQRPCGLYGCRRQSWEDRYFKAADGDFRF